MTLPRPLLLLGIRRRLVALGAVTLLAGLAMLPAMATMADHGATVLEFETAGDVATATEILDAWGAAGRDAAWWQLALDTPFVLGYGLLLSAGCAAVGQRAVPSGQARLARLAPLFASAGIAAATADLLQNFSLALVLGGEVTQPWLRISAVAVPLIFALAIPAALFALLGGLLTRSR